MEGALKRFRIVAWIVGTLLIALMFVAMPMKYIWGDDSLIPIVSMPHGFMFMVYLVLGFDLARRAEWPFWPRTVGVLLSGTVPVVSFIVERWVHRTVVAENLSQEAAQEPLQRAAAE
ncbi:DUF3817 domain-containing protein [Natronoglycomyces albus]|uniref:DUF3817 domain-containing protein n=1 Tax=Natronoglycomyces albus TaxID=2811108 RepID=A0A895XMM2_9ACTN|nr:DUF3817 domain-containing protein [Natronoglycomyces albus]QSB04265.1 DUF3817 domain-containing protein [Natronoglycomyces albus]